MADTLEGADKSLWVATTEKTNYPELAKDDTTYDVAVVGGGITGVMTAYLLQKRGFKTALVEKGRIVEWTTGGTTAKLTSQHYLIYDYLIKRHGREVAAVYARANQDGIDSIERLSHELGIDCDFSRTDAYVFTNQDDRLDDIRAEVDAAKSLGLPAAFEDSVALPFPSKAAVRFSNQAQFHPRKFLLPLAEKFVQAGGVLYEQTEATDIELGEPNVVVAKQGKLKATHVVQASGEPFWHRDIFDGHMWLKMSYGLAVRLKSETTYPKGMYITTDEPLRTIRTSPYQDGQVLIFGGESHEYDSAKDETDARYATLIKDVKQKFDVDTVLYRWLAGDYMPYDRIPYFGQYPDHPSIYAITGYRAWGLAWAASAANAIVGYIDGKPLDWAKYFSFSRLEQPVRPEDKTTKL